MKKNLKKEFIAATLLGALIMPCIIFTTGCGMESQVQVATYEELVEAIKGDKSVVCLTEDIDLQEQIVVNRKVKIDLNGKTISVTNDIWNGDTNVWSVISVRENGDATITGEGKIQTKENDSYCMDVMDGGKLVIENGEFVGNISSVYAYEGDVLIKGGTYSIQQLSSEYGYRLTINLYDVKRREEKANIKISGGEFKNFDPSNPMEEGYKLLEEGYEAKLVEGSTTDYIVTKTA